MRKSKEELAKRGPFPLVSQLDNIFRQGIRRWEGWRAPVRGRLYNYGGAGGRAARHETAQLLDL